MAEREIKLLCGKTIDHPNVTNCLLDENPFHEYLVRVTELVGIVKKRRAEHV